MITSLINKVIITVGMAATANLTQITYKEVFIEKTETKYAKHIDSLTAVIEEISKPPKTKDSSVVYPVKEGQCKKHKYQPTTQKGVEVCKLCGHVLLPQPLDGARGPRLGKDKPTPTYRPDTCCLALEKELRRKPLVVHDTFIKHDTNRVEKVVEKTTGMKKIDRGRKNEH